MALRKKKVDEAKDVVASQPGTVIIPGGSAPAAVTTNAPKAVAETPETAVPPIDDNQTASAPSPTNIQDDGQAIHWTASEFIAHQKSASWYGLLALGAIVIAALIYLLTKDLISAIVVLVGALALGYYGARQPRQLDYQLDAEGVTIGPKFYPYSGFRSFAIVPEGAFSSIVFMPLKRFAPLTTIYYAPNDEDKIVNLLSSILPTEPHHSDAVDSLMRRIRF